MTPEFSAHPQSFQWANLDPRYRTIAIAAAASTRLTPLKIQRVRAGLTLAVTNSGMPKPRESARATRPPSTHPLGGGKRSQYPVRNPTAQTNTAVRPAAARPRLETRK